MHFLIYIPGAERPDLTDLDRVGLSDLRENAFSTICHQGPDEGRGVLWGWQNSDDRRLHLVCDLERQTWLPAVATGALESQRYWVGIDNAQPPTPANLQRAVIFGGKATPLGAHEWIVPQESLMPRRITRTDHGLTTEYLTHQEFRTTCEYWRIKLSKLQDGGDVGLEELLTFVEMALKCNYRLTTEVADYLQLWTDGPEGSLTRALFAIVSRGGGHA